MNIINAHILNIPYLFTGIEVTMQILINNSRIIVTIIVTVLVALGYTIPE